MADKRSKIIIPDAQIIIDLHSSSLWKHIIQTFNIGITPIIVQESRFYKDGQGKKMPILLKDAIEAKSIRAIKTSVEQIAHLYTFLHPNIQSPLDPGELEAIAFLKSQKTDDHIFVSGDALAIKYIGALGLRHRSISLQKLFEQRGIKTKLEHKYSESRFQTMLDEGFRDSQFLITKPSK
jgi:hypothetical protein